MTDEVRGAENAERPARPRAAVRLLFVVFLALTCGLVIEVTARVAYSYKDSVRGMVPSLLHLNPHQEPDPRFPGHWRLRAGFRQTVSDAQRAKQQSGRVLGAQYLEEAVTSHGVKPEDVFIQINSAGFRGPEIDPSHSKLRVLTIGDSCTFGTIESGTYTRVLARELAQRGKPVEAINGGVEGYSPRNVILRLDEYKSLHPEIVTIYIGWNALYSDGADPIGAPTLYTARFIDIGRRMVIHYWRGPQAAALSAYRKEKRADPQDPVLARLSGVVPGFLAEVQQIAHAFRAAGSRVFLITLPGLFVSDEMPSEEAMRIGHLPLFTANPLVLARLSENYNAALRDFAGRDGFGLIDLDRWSRSALRPRERYFFDSVHFNEDGQALVGREIAAHLASDLDGSSSSLARQ